MPIGAIAVPAGAADLEMHAVVASLDGMRIIRYKKIGMRTEAEALGRQVAEGLLKQGAADVLQEAKAHESETPDPQSLRLT
jgi:hydroxymethylbilane synthase